MNTIKVEDVVKNAIHYGVSLMGDDFIGYKFVGKNNDFWNSILFELRNNGRDVGEILNSEWLKENGIEYMEHDSNVWNG